MKFGRGNLLRWVIYPSLIMFAVYHLVIAPDLLSASSSNGFDLSNSEIPVRKIESGGPPRDGIPAINSPQFISANDAAAFMQAEDRVIGLEINGVARTISGPARGTKPQSVPVIHTNWRGWLQEHPKSSGVFTAP